VSPRSEEFTASARERLGTARAALEAGFSAGAVSAAYYAVLYAARAALSEQDRYAKTHRGTWSLFGELFVATGRFDADLARGARRMQEIREGGDYDARSISPDEARGILTDADAFVAAIENLLAG
jgi:uncharacterized protein (UPF0332 family)